jgi:hypothetical protein
LSTPFSTALLHGNFKIGDEIHLSCTYKNPIIGCKFRIPNESNEIKLSEHAVNSNNKTNDRFKYFGRGFVHGDCGITIRNVTIESQGHAKCILTVGNDEYGNARELNETVEIKLFKTDAMQINALPKMKILNTNPLKVGQMLSAECVLKINGNQNKFNSIVWLLDENIINSSNINNSRNYEELKSTLKYGLSEFDDQKILKCRTKLHSDSTQYVDAIKIINVYKKTQKLEAKVGRPFDVIIEFSSKSRPPSTKWIVNEKHIYIGRASSEYLSRELKLKSLRNNLWIAVLHIKNVTNVNLHHNYTLQVDDASEGRKFFTKRIDANKHQVEDITETTPQAPTTTSTTFPPDTQTNFIKHSQKTNLYRPISRRNERYKTNNNSTPLTNRRNTTISSTEMTSVTSSFSSPISSTQVHLVLLKTHQNNIMSENSTLAPHLTSINRSINNKNNNKRKSFGEEKDEHSFNGTLSTTHGNSYEITFNEINFTSGNNNNDNLLEKNTINEPVKFENFFITISFTSLVVVMIIFLLMLCHYKRQVSMLRTEVIQMNMENYYNQSNLHSSTLNDYSFARRNHGNCSYNSASLSTNSSEDFMKDSSHTTNGENSQSIHDYSPTYNIYQSIDDIDTHVYDEIIQTKAGAENKSIHSSIDAKPNNYENNESFNSKCNAGEQFVFEMLNQVHVPLFLRASHLLPTSLQIFYT